MDNQTSEPERRADGRAGKPARALNDEMDEPDRADEQDRASGEEPGAPQGPSTLERSGRGKRALEGPVPGTPPRRRRQLTRREREIASLIGEGLTSRHVAERLVISERTVDSHAEHIRDKLGLHSRAQIAAWAVDQGLVKHPPGGCAWIRSCF